MTRELTLSRGMVAIVDDSDFALVGDRKWYAEGGANTFYAVRTGPRDSGGHRERVVMHRLILGLPRWAGVGSPEVDHINGDGLDNRRSNLREVTHQENARNRVNSVKPRPCEMCLAVFTPPLDVGRFCSQRCFGIWNTKERVRPGCEVDGCDRLHVALGWCKMHYARVVAHGSPGLAAPLRNRRSKLGLP